MAGPFELRGDFERVEAAPHRVYRPEGERPPSSLLFVSDGRGLVVALEYIGPDLDYIMADSIVTSLLVGQLAEEHPFPGIWVWEGRVVGRRDYWGEYDEEYTGDVRPLTEDEREALQRGDLCFDPRLWHAEPSP